MLKNKTMESIERKKHTSLIIRDSDSIPFIWNWDLPLAEMALFAAQKINKLFMNSKKWNKMNTW